MTHDLVIRNGLVVDGTGADPVHADVAVTGDRITDVGAVDGPASRTIDAEGRVVTPGFVDIHSHLDAQIAWDPILSSSCWHGVTSVVIGNCGVTFAPCRPDDRRFLAELMESVEDIPADSILDGLPWDWESYGEYLASIERMPKGINVGGMVGHCAVRYAVMGDRSADDAPATDDEIAQMVDLVDEAIGAGALGFSTSRTLLHKVPDGRHVPGTWADEREMLALGDVLGRHHAGVYEAALRFERDNPDYDGARRELAWLGESSRRTGRPATFGITQADARPELYERAIGFAEDANASGANVRPQTTVRGVGLLFGLECDRTPFDAAPEWRGLHGLALADKLARLRDPASRAALVAAAPASSRLDPWQLFVLSGDDVVYEPEAANSLAGRAEAQGQSVPEAFCELMIDTGGRAVLTYPFLNQRMDAIEEMIANPTVVLGLADAGAHVSQILDAGQPSYLLRDWVRDRGRLPLAEAVRRLTSDTAELFGLAGRGVLRAGAVAGVNVIDLEGLRIPAPELVDDFPGGASRFLQRSEGYDYTLVGGQVFMDHGEHTDVLAGCLLRS